MFCKVCNSAHATYRCPSLRKIVNQVEEKTMERRINMLNFICSSGLNIGRPFETNSTLWPQEVFGDSVKINIFWEPKEFGAIEYCNSKYLFTNYTRGDSKERVHLEQSVLKWCFGVRATPIKLFLWVDKPALSGIINKWFESGPVVGYGFAPFGENINLIDKRFLYKIFARDLMDKIFEVDDLPNYMDFNFDIWNLAGLQAEDYNTFSRELRIYYAFVSNREVKNIYDLYRMSNVYRQKIDRYDFDISKYCKLEFNTTGFKPEVPLEWTDKDIKKVVNKIVKAFY